MHTKQHQSQTPMVLGVMEIVVLSLRNHTGIRAKLPTVLNMASLIKAKSNSTIIWFATQELKGLVLSTSYRAKQNARTLTESLPVMDASSIPHNLPQAAPISRDGMKTPADTARP